MKINPNEAPDGYVAVPEIRNCQGCALDEEDDAIVEICINCACHHSTRKDGQSVIFKKREQTEDKPTWTQPHNCADNRTKSAACDICGSVDLDWGREESQPTRADQLLQGLIQLVQNGDRTWKSALMQMAEYAKSLEESK